MTDKPFTRLGAVLAGGRSSRFGSDKAEARLDGEPLIDRAAAAIAPYADAVVAVGGPARAGLETVPDRPKPGLGPLGGIVGALAAAADRGHAGALTIACDTPELPAGLVEALLRRGPSYCVEAPTIGWWPVEMLDGLLAYLAEVDGPAKDGRLSVRAWVRQTGAIPISAGAPVANVNTPDDLDALRGRVPAA